jgi:crotonobetainyl-CoA:carnitine CoA-transferase CaiB-like acyl-CoA transferase
MHAVVPRLSGTPGRIDGPGGSLGRDTDTVLGEELGLSATQIDDLRLRAVI